MKKVNRSLVFVLSLGTVLMMQAMDKKGSVPSASNARGMVLRREPRYTGEVKDGMPIAGAVTADDAHRYLVAVAKKAAEKGGEVKGTRV